MPHAQTPAERGLVPKDKSPELAGLVAGRQKVEGWIWRSLLGDRVQEMINREGEEGAYEDLAWFLEREPEEPLEILDRPMQEWGQLLVELSPAVYAAVGPWRNEEELRPVTKAELMDLKESRLHEGLHLVVANQ